MSTYPSYPLPSRLLASISLSCLTLQPRSFQQDAIAAVGKLKNICIEGRDNIPDAPYLLTFNHYHRPGFNILWLVMAIAAALPLIPPQRLGAVMTAELTFPGQFYSPLGRPLSRFVLKRLAQIYGFIGMPPMPPRPQDVQHRARSIRKTLDWLDHTTAPMLLLAPEGGDNMPPPPGTGRFIALIAARGLWILPAAGWEQDGALHVRFGVPYQLHPPEDLPRDQFDQSISRFIMQRITENLPA